MEKLAGAAQLTMWAFCNNEIVNDTARKGGSSPSQRVLGKSPRSVGDVCDADEFAVIGVQQERIDPQSAFNKLARLRLACTEALAHIDCSHKVAAVTLRKAAPVPAVGDIISFKR